MNILVSVLMSEDSTEACPKSHGITLFWRVIGVKTSCSSAHTNLYLAKNRITPQEGFHPILARWPRYPHFELGVDR